MFEGNLTKCLRPINVQWTSPTRMNLDAGDGEGLRGYDLLKGAENYLHKEIELKVPTSKEVYKKSEQIWKDLRDNQLNMCKERARDEDKFDLLKSTVIYLTTENGDIVDIADLKTETLLNNFMDSHEKFNIDYSTKNVSRRMFQDCKGGMVKHICYPLDCDIVNDDYVPIVIMELNNNKSQYKAYSGILIYKTFTIIPSLSPDIEEDSLISFIKRFDMQQLLDYATDRGNDLYKAYERFKESAVEISVREITALFKKVGYKFEFDDNPEKIRPIEQLIDEENNLKVQEFYNTFNEITGETALDIIQLSEFRKTFRYNKMTILNVLSIMSKEYLTYESDKITADILGGIVYKLYDEDAVDKSQVEIIEKETR